MAFSALQKLKSALSSLTGKKADAKATDTKAVEQEPSPDSNQSSQAAAPVAAPVVGTDAGADAGADSTALAGKPENVSEDKAFVESLEELEELMIEADFGPRLAARFVSDLRSNKIKPGQDFAEVLISWMGHWLEKLEQPLVLRDSAMPTIMFLGVNGSGKTTSIAKVAGLLKKAGRKPLLVPADTFRAAAIEQLDVWSKRAQVPMAESAAGKDPAAVVFASYDKAASLGADCLLIDTAGRLHNKAHLMEELTKMVRVITKRLEGEPQSKILVFDASSGQAAFSQLESFHKAIDLTGIIVTKLDGSARGGVLVALSEKYEIPIHFIGTGEQLDDIKPFEAKPFLRAMFGDV